MPRLRQAKRCCPDARPALLKRARHNLDCHELRGDDIFFQVIDLTTKPAPENRPEKAATC
jgi:beta-galactosidase beta subunit